MELQAAAFEQVQAVAVRLASRQLTPAQLETVEREARARTIHGGRGRRSNAARSYQAEFLEAASEATGDDCFGLNLAERTEPREFGAIYYVVASSATALSAIRNFARYRHAVDSRGTLLVEDSGEFVVLQSTYVGGLESRGRQIIEWGDAVFLSVLRDLTQTPLAPLAVEMPHQRESGVVALNSFFQCAVRFGANRHTSTFLRTALEAPILSADHYLLNVLKGFFEEALRRRGAASAPTRSKAEQVLVELLPTGKATAANVAKTLAMSERTFARRLSEEGVNYATLIDELRRDLAMGYLEDQNLELNEIAWLLGYSEVTSFNHAFRRWTSSTPKAVRADMRDRQRTAGIAC